MTSLTLAFVPQESHAIGELGSWVGGPEPERSGQGGGRRVLRETGLLLCKQMRRPAPPCCSITSKKRKETSHLGKKRSFCAELLLKIADFYFFILLISKYVSLLCL